MIIYDSGTHRESIKNQEDPKLLLRKGKQNNWCIIQMHVITYHEKVNDYFLLLKAQGHLRPKIL